MRTVLSAVLALVLFTPANARASSISFTVSEFGELLAVFGSSVPFSVVSPIQDPRKDGVSALDSISGSLELVSGPLVSLVIDPVLERTIYTYGPGTLAMTATWTKNPPDDVEREGTFVSTLMGFQLFVCEGCDSHDHASSADDLVIDLGPGLFSESFARSLGVGRATTGGEFSVPLEDISGDPTEGFRVAASQIGHADLLIDATEAVPEPSLVLLGLTFGAMAIGRRTRYHAGK